jgi:hypothetical protein
MAKKPTPKLNLSRETLKNLKNPTVKTGIKAGFRPTDACSGKVCCPYTDPTCAQTLSD